MNAAIICLIEIGGEPLNLDRVELCFSQVPGTPLVGRSLQEALRQMLKRAKRSIVLCSCEFSSQADFILNEEVVAKMQINREVSVYGNDPTQMKSMKAIYSDLGMRVYVWKPPRDRSLFHIKAIIVDDVQIYMGSANMSKNAMTNSAEWGIIANSPEICQKLRKYLDDLIESRRFEEVD